MLNPLKHDYHKQNIETLDKIIYIIVINYDVEVIHINYDELFDCRMNLKNYYRLIKSEGTTMTHVFKISNEKLWKIIYNQDNKESEEQTDSILPTKRNTKWLYMEP